MSSAEVCAKISSESADAELEAAGGQFFLDGDTGRYYYQTADGDVMVLASKQGNEKEPSDKDSEAEDDMKIVIKEQPQGLGFNYASQLGRNRPGRKPNPLTTVDISQGEAGKDFELVIVRAGEEDDVLKGFEEDTKVTAATGVVIIDKDTRLKKQKPEEAATLPRVYKCSQCDYTNGKKYFVVRHMKSHSEDRPHQCSFCAKGFRTKKYLQNHINTHTGTKPYVCKFCDRRFGTQGEMVRHVRYKHTMDKPHKCKVCGYSSVESTKLKRHILLSHSGEKPLKCSTCDYATADPFRLKRHLVVHTGEKPFECDICHMRFTQQGSMKSHRRKHTGEKPKFPCESCPAVCGTRHDLKLHVKNMHTPLDKMLSCGKCEEQFADRYSYRAHLRSHRGEKCFQCDLCPYASESRLVMQNHLLTHAPKRESKRWRSARVRTKSLKAQEMDELEDDVKEDDVGPLEGDDQEQRLAAEVLEENHGTYEITGEHISHEPPEATKVGEVVDEEDENEIVTYT